MKLGLHHHPLPLLFFSKWLVLIYNHAQPKSLDLSLRSICHGFHVSIGLKNNLEAYWRAVVRVGVSGGMDTIKDTNGHVF